MPRRYTILETSNGFVLDSEWDAEGEIEHVYLVFQGKHDDLKDAIEKLTAYLIDIYKD